jgi:hypothetical protein
VSALAAVAVAALVAAPARAAPDRGQFSIAVKLGATVPQPFSRLTTSYLVGFDVGWAPPIWKRRFTLVLDGALTSPTANGSDPVVADARWSLVAHEALLGLVVEYRHAIGRVVPYVGAGVRVYFLDSRVSGDVAGAHIATTSERSVRAGGVFPVGVGVTLGPGHLFVELTVSVATVDGRTTGPANAGFLSAALGYRVTF